MISISAGHWAEGTGASGLIDEVREARKVAKRITEILRSNGVTVNYIEDNTSTNKRDNLNYLVTQHNKTKRKLDVSVHFNASSGQQSKGIGTEVLYYSAKDLATKLSGAISSASGLIDRGAKQRKDLAILNSTNAPAVLLEICFVNSTVDVAVYRRDFEKICQTIAATLLDHLGIVTPGGETMQLLNETARKEAKEIIKRAVTDGTFTNNHENLESYQDHELISFVIAYVNRKIQ